MLERGELPTMEEFAEQYENWLVNYYHKHSHSGLKKQGEESPIPIKVFQNTEHYYKAAPPYKYLVSLLMKSMKRTVSSMGIQMTFSGETLYYNNPMLRKGQKVLVRYMPDDLSKIFVYSLKEELLCEAVTAGLLNIMSSYSEKGKIGEDAVAAHVKEQKRQLKKARETIRKRQMPFEYRQLSLADSGKKVIMPELATEQEDTVAIPKSSRHIKEERLEKESKEMSIQEERGDNSSGNIEDDYIDAMFNYFQARNKEAL